MKSVTLQTNNLMNSQWPDLFAFDVSLPAKMFFLSIDSTVNYYSTERVIEFENRPFKDRSEPSNLNNKIINIFSQVEKSERLDSPGHDTREIDRFRQGTEIRNGKQWSAGTIKILAGTPGHLIKPQPIGLNELNDLSGKNYFQELDLFNSLDFIRNQTGKLTENTITFPIVVSDANQRENDILNGIIEPFPIRTVISRFSINYPFEPYGISATLQSGNEKLRDRTDQVVSITTYDPSYVNNNAFTDSGNQFIMEKSDGTFVELGPTLAFEPADVNNIKPFNDEIPPAGDYYLSTRNYSTEFLEIIKQMPKQGETYLKSNEISGRTGFVYDNTTQIVDSIVYGGTLR